MRFQLFTVIIYRSSGRVRGHVVAPFEEQAAQIVCGHPLAMSHVQALADYPLSGLKFSYLNVRFWGDGVDAPRRHRCAIMEVFKHH